MKNKPKTLSGKELYLELKRLGEESQRIGKEIASKPNKYI